MFTALDTCTVLLLSASGYCISAERHRRVTVSSRIFRNTIAGRFMFMGLCIAILCQ